MEEENRDGIKGFSATDTADIKKLVEAFRRLSLHKLRGGPTPQEIAPRAASYFKRFRENAVSIDLVVKICATIVDTSRYFPTVADLLELAARKRAPTDDVVRALPPEAIEAREYERREQERLKSEPQSMKASKSEWAAGLARLRAELARRAMEAAIPDGRVRDAQTATEHHVDNLEPERRAAALGIIEQFERQQGEKESAAPESNSPPAAAAEPETPRIVRFKSRVKVDECA